MKYAATTHKDDIQAIYFTDYFANIVHGIQNGFQIKRRFYIFAISRKDSNVVIGDVVFIQQLVKRFNQCLITKIDTAIIANKSNFYVLIFHKSSSLTMR